MKTTLEKIKRIIQFILKLINCLCNNQHKDG